MRYICAGLLQETGISILFRPPIAPSRVVRLHQVLGFGQSSDPFWNNVRAQQLAVLDEHLPFNIGLLSINVVAMLATVGRVSDDASFQMISILVSLLGAVWLGHWLQRRKSLQQVSAIRFWAISAEIVAFGLCWGALMLHLLPNALPDQQALLIIVSMIAMGACAFATVVVPTAGVLLVAAIACGTLAGLPVGAPLAQWPVKLALVTYVALIARGTVGSTVRLMARLRMEADSVEQADVIALLLREFETNGSDWLFEVDGDGLVTRASARFVDVAGRLRQTIVGRPLLALLGDDRRGAESRDAVRRLRSCFDARQSFRDLVVPVPAGDDTHWWQLSGTPKFDQVGRFTGYRGVGSDVTDTRAAGDRIALLAHFDALTGLANRSVIRDKVNDALRAARRTGSRCALLFIDLDRFKAVNDTLGHRAGDLVLCDVAKRLREAVGEGIDIGRLGGDEFAVVLNNSNERVAERVARVIVAVLAQPFSVEGQSVSIGASVGIAIGPTDGASVDLLLRSADLALYEVKGSGRGHACRFLPAIQNKAEKRRRLELDLYGALDRGELALAFQPIVKSSNEHIVGFEALLRWHHPILGIILPAQFMPVAEDSRLIKPIGQWVIEEVCRWAAGWPETIMVAVNMSSVELADERLSDMVITALTENNIHPSRLEMIITEEFLSNEKSPALTAVTTLQTYGVCFALDDFGTGNASLSFLHKVKLGRLKIDRGFVQRAAADNGESISIIKAIVSLARSLGIATTAKGCETHDEFDVVQNLGCDHVQGHLFGAEMSPDAATALVAELAMVPQLTLVK